MPRSRRNLAVSLAVLLLAMQPASAGNADAPTADALLNGINIPPIPGQPFSATVVIESQHFDDDGNPFVRRTINLVARDAKGRTHNESRRLMPEFYHGSPPLTWVRLFDPATSTRIAYYPALHIARRQIVPTQPPPPSPPSREGLKVEDLGIDTLSGVKAHGTRRTYVVEKGIFAVRRAVEAQDEIWYSDELRINILARHSDPRVGVETIGLSEIKRGEPPPSMFEVPPGYKIVDMNPERAPSTDAVPGQPPVQAAP
jgi:hypothetical protein